jgi:hypothetical protein
MYATSLTAEKTCLDEDVAPFPLACIIYYNLVNMHRHAALGVAHSAEGRSPSTPRDVHHNLSTPLQCCDAVVAP